MSSSLLVVVFFALTIAQCSAQESLDVYTLFKWTGAGVKAVENATILQSSVPATYGGDFSRIGTNGLNITLWDTDGDVFFGFSTGAGYCVIDVDGVPFDNTIAYTLWTQNGLQCTLSLVSQARDVIAYGVTFTPGHAGDCDRNHNPCPKPPQPKWI